MADPKPSQDGTSKVFDVAKPEDTQLNTGAKPMVIGHKSLAADPSIREAGEVTEEKVSKTEVAAPAKKVTITPPSSDAASEKEPVANETEASKPEAEKPTEPETPAKNESEKEAQPEDAATAEDKRSAEIESLVASKEFFVPIKQKSSFSFAKFLGFLLVIVITIVAAAAALLYSGVIDTDVSLPFRDKEESSVSETVATAVPAEEIKPDEESARRAVPTQPTEYSLTFPDTWKFARAITELEPEMSYFTDTYTLPSGAKLIMTQDIGGRGGMCEPEANEVPHEAGNTCPTVELLAKKELVQSEKITAFLKDEKVFLVREYYTDTDGTSEYAVCLTNYSEDGFSLDVNEPYMGFVIKDCGPGVKLKSMGMLIVSVQGIVNDSEDFFENKDVIEIEKALETFKIL